MVEIARALSHDASVIIMDEPTAALSAHEIDELFRIVDQLKAEGRAILFISHKFDEIFRVSDRWVCLRDGEKVGEGLTRDVREADLVRLMVGPPRSTRSSRSATSADRRRGARGRGAVERHRIRGHLASRCARGEILGFYGLVGAGPLRGHAVPVRHEPADARARRAWTASRSRSAAPADAIAAGIAYVPEDRQHQGARAAARHPREHHAGLARRACAARLAVAPLGTRRDPRARQRGLSVKAAHWEQTPGRTLGRQPAEGGDRQMAGDQAEGRHPRRADQGHRRRLQGRRARLHRRTGRGGPGRDPDHLRTAGGHGPRRPGHRHAGRAHRRRASSAARPGWSAEAIVAAATGAPIAGRRRNEAPRHAIANCVLAAHRGRHGGRASALYAPAFGTRDSLLGILNDTAFLFMMALAQMIVILTRGIDLSVAANLALTGMLTAMLARLHPELPVARLRAAVALSSGSGFGLVNGSLDRLPRHPADRRHARHARDLPRHDRGGRRRRAGQCLRHGRQFPVLARS